MSLPVNNWHKLSDLEQPECGCASWQQHWLRVTQHRWPATCYVAGCHNRATHAAHIQHANDPRHWVLPMCEECYQASGAFTIKSVVTLVRSKQARACLEVLEEVEAV